MCYIVQADEYERHAGIGGKGKALDALQRAGLPIPCWCAVTPEAFITSLSSEEQQQLDAAESYDDIRQVIDQLTPCQAVVEEITAAVAALCPEGGAVAVRSSALDEDGAQHSFAGQLESYLFVPPEQVAEKVAAVWKSGFSERIFAYRREHQLSIVPQPPAVIIQRMVDAEVAGVSFSADPVSGRRGLAVVSAVYGLGTSLVSGESDADIYQVDRSGRIIERHIAEKLTAHRADLSAPEGVKSEPVMPALVSQPALTDAEVQAVAGLSRQAERHFACPQDIEWAIADGQLYLLQSRPITSLRSMPDPDGMLNLWDNSNIAESYGGVTTPLTFSFARNAYQHVYRQFCVMMGVSKTVIAEHDETFHRMLGLIRGRIYYNLLSWYRILALLPGFTVNRRFMEQMMGVKEGLPDELVKVINQATWRDRFSDGLHLLFTCGKLVANYMALPCDIQRFYTRLHEALLPSDPPLELMRADELAGYYRSLERKLLTRWDAPLINDFFAMIFYGLLRRCAERWCDDTEGTLQNDLLSGQGGIISAEPAQRMQAMARTAAAYPDFAALLREGTLDQIMHAMLDLPDFKQQYDEYLEKFGDRCLEELKLESATLHDDSLLLLRAVGQLAGSRQESATPVESDLCSQAEARVRKALGWNLFRRFLFSWVLRIARHRVRDRENLRFERTRLFGRVRRIFMEMGRRFFTDGLLANPRDIFYLEINDIIGLVDGTTTCADISGLVAVRKEEFTRYREMPAPDDRFETHGVVHHANTYQQERNAVSSAEGEQRKGIGCCPGVVRGKVRVITDPRNALFEQGSILVAERTDPGWIMLFPAAKGVLVERGSVLSHSAIVARELRIPAIVSVPGITSWLRDGDLVEFDGSTGIVRRITGVSDAE